MRFKRITVDPGKMGGMPCIRGFRITVATVVDLFANGLTDKRYFGIIQTWNREI